MKHILMAVVWLMAVWPCMHVTAADDHMHDAACGIELIASADHDCHCHSCEITVCTDKVVETPLPFSTAGCLPPQTTRNILFVQPDPLIDEGMETSISSGILRELLTVQLLI